MTSSNPPLLNRLLGNSKFVTGLGDGLTAGGLVASAIGTYADIRARQYEADIQASNLRFQSSIAQLNARAAELDARAILEAGEREAGRSGLVYRKIIEENRAQFAARGVQAGVGSAAEVQASTRFAAKSDQISITAGAVRAANAARRRGVNQQNQALLAEVAARNLERSAGALDPFVAAGGTLLGGLAQR